MEIRLKTSELQTSTPATKGDRKNGAFFVYRSRGGNLRSESV